MANIATFLFQHDDTPNRVLYRQFIDNEWVDFKAREMIDLARSWQAFFPIHGLTARRQGRHLPEEQCSLGGV